MPNTNSLNRARKLKFDEFYTQLQDIENELQYYTEFFKDKIVYCNCDNPYKSNFVKYFVENFNKLGLKKLIATYYVSKKPSIKFEWFKSQSLNDVGGIKNLQIKQTPLLWYGDFRSIENIQILKSCDVVVTNPPFSLFQDYVEQLISFKKKFLIIGNLNFASTIYGFNLLHSNQIRFGVTKISKFNLPDNTMVNLGSCYWYTNLPVKISHKKLELTKYYNEKDYPKYDNYNAIEVSKVADIPCDYDGVMGVPINIMLYDLEDYKVVGHSNHINLKLNGKLSYKRIFIQRV